ncbi:MAG: hypothetical protein IPI48_03650 [bacterium]|nr:hypothetical protein [bacterium]
MAHLRRLQPVLGLALLFIAGGFGAAHAVPGDENWGTDFGAPGADRFVHASIAFEGDLVIGGSFDAVGGLGAQHLARWDGTAWSEMGETFNDDVNCLAIWNGALYAGGGFTACGATPMSGLARWDGAGWVAVGGGVDGYVEDLAVWNGMLAVGGYFESVDGGSLSTAHVAIWDGANWDEMDGGMNNGPVSDVEVFAGSLYACGQFDYAGSSNAPNLARWNGSSWSAVGGGLTDDMGDPFEAYAVDMAVHAGKLVVAGRFARAGAVTVDGIVTWNGTVFAAPGVSSFGGSVTEVGLYGANLVAASEAGIIRTWNGTFWNHLGGIIGSIATSTEYGGGVVFGGSFELGVNPRVANVALYTGTWSALAEGQGANLPVRGFHEWNGTLIAGGSFSRIGGVSGSMVAAWDGSGWAPLGSGVAYQFGGGVESFTTFEGDLIAGGSFTTAGGVPANKIARWNGTQWSAMGAGSLSTVSGLLTLGGELYANGYWAGNIQTLGRWNGADFTPLGGTISGGVQILHALGAYGGQPVMGGHFTSIGGTPAMNIARWDGAAWHALGAGPSGAVYAIHEADGLLYVGGGFAQAGGQPALNIAVWDGANWSALGAGVNGRVFDITSAGGSIYVTGEFTQAGGQSALYIARWDGAAWHGLGSGLNAKGHALRFVGNDLMVGGEFTLAGNSGSLRIARWTTAASAVDPAPDGRARFFMGPGRPNPFTGATTLSFALPQPSDVVIDVFDIRGARVRSLARAGLGAGPHQVTWDGRDAAGLPAPAGVYFVALRGGDAAARQRVTLVR